MTDRDGMVALTRTINGVGEAFEQFKATNAAEVGAPRSRAWGA
jgi:hypothetical protein